MAGVLACALLAIARAISIVYAQDVRHLSTNFFPLLPQFCVRRRSSCIHDAGVPSAVGSCSELTVYFVQCITLEEALKSENLTVFGNIYQYIAVRIRLSHAQLCMYMWFGARVQQACTTGSAPGPYQFY
jgi:hypothetical protein